MKTKVCHSNGFSLIELMITIAIITIISAIAIPAYNGYIEEARFSAARMNAEPLRLALEDYFLENNTYIAGSWEADGNPIDLQTGNLAWHPDGDGNNYNYSVAALNADIATGYILTVTDINYAEASIQCTRNQTAGTFRCATNTGS
ncbi:type IV pilin protein [Candidatus Endoriftia persephonae]|jgi:type IV pilus assembly protein PilE|uniref:Uncharacterized protein n=3 Tax=sulfur-oxidizing symbionts TaxID=32036 RepID=G2FEH9_9GAMM|nr:prepilin-type N-terminal cleavage/methylation domain-containing protein [Candidatus Endoriftia persephone]EGW54748.1 hypothetical protein TevJSym_ai00280 [endosymbiont of Tevnia jerichonana (vent Tica)]KRT55088.1 prepilin-type N-terminal cleavage/methylation domain [endosymbiont of Ridgeia piscesae]KRT57036.1 type IV pilus assembly protein PilE [endosymbiont of Ridgeia piscesae]